MVFGATHHQHARGGLRRSATLRAQRGDQTIVIYRRGCPKRSLKQQSLRTPPARAGFFILYAPTYQVRFRHLRVRSAKAHSYLPLSGIGHCAGLGRAQKKFGSILLNFHLAPPSKKFVFLPALIMVLPSIIVLFGGNSSGRHQNKKPQKKKPKRRQQESRESEG